MEHGLTVHGRFWRASERASRAGIRQNRRASQYLTKYVNLSQPDDHQYYAIAPILLFEKKQSVTLCSLEQSCKRIFGGALEIDQRDGAFTMNGTRYPVLPSHAE
ncbi:hypothetical protein CERSUDRAFT_107312 [Gelatoporia subvermispora B]|uniref:Uncharacterized protein n=1 Tax=Ceriporiopsis subvermispora (strain B) TaxID=914234 RepID=M2QR77_CERS8|nr:hypothetical protein CERSUDRAFT_107312 [Gelatoporia subvermispora B]